jgi:murein DD-endopeptidase MepM/ murein hydrolase activator NlpD
MLRPARAALLCLAAAAPAAAPPPVLRSPVPGTCVTSPFGARGPVGRHATGWHSGIDLRAPAGTWVLAAAAGQVAAIRHRGALGLEVDIRLPGGALTRYAHLGSVAPALANGRSRVSTGTRIGRAGRTGTTYGAHLHFELRLGGHAVDPAPYLHLPHC